MKKNNLAAFVVMLILGFSLPAWAQTPPPQTMQISGCTSVKWQANTEPDLAGYRIYVGKDGAPGIPFPIAKDVTTAQCADLGITEDGVYLIQLVAYDTSGNESLPTRGMELDWPDKTPPATVTSVCWDITTIVVDTATGKILSATPGTHCE